MNQDLLQRAKAIKLAVFDVDGVLTDGRLYFLEDGSEFKTFNTLDGQGIKMLMAAGVTTRSSAAARRRWSSAGRRTSASRTCSRAARTNWWCWTACWPNST
jgi:3-deoxy-D-manno-octulosonate 8-phosphate phosphatase KdsC-like HAD superfamily phosphatase